MKKLFLSLSVPVVFAFYVFYKRGELLADTYIVTPPATSQQIDQNVPANQTDSAPNSGAKPTTQSKPPGTSLPPPTSKPIGQYKNGQYTGNVVDAYYGNVQVKAIITGGKITDVQFLQYPNDRRNSVVINRQAMPYLTSEAIQVQSAQVNIVSGATATSRAFRLSLASALVQAKN